jgi:hypothetical protein
VWLLHLGALLHLRFEPKYMECYANQLCITGSNVIITLEKMWINEWFCLLLLVPLDIYVTVINTSVKDVMLHNYLIKCKF